MLLVSIELKKLNQKLKNVPVLSDTLVHMTILFLFLFLFHMNCRSTFHHICSRQTGSVQVEVLIWRWVYSSHGSALNCETMIHRISLSCLHCCHDKDVMVSDVHWFNSRITQKLLKCVNCWVLILTLDRGDEAEALRGKWKNVFLWWSVWSLI